MGSFQKFSEWLFFQNTYGRTLPKNQTELFLERQWTHLAKGKGTIKHNGEY